MNTLQNQLSFGDYLRFRDLVLERSGLYFPEKKRRDLEIGVLKALNSASHELKDPNTYYKFLQEKATPDAQAEMDRLINLLTIGETHFFRDNAQFEALANYILPALIARKRAGATAFGPSYPANRPQLRLWSAGCATGEEAYSLAILVRELIPDLANWQVLILATDINRESLQRARDEATYSDWSFREYRAKTAQQIYFTRQGKRYKLRDDVRQMVTFAYHNLISDDFPAIHNNTGSMDLIICRNVTIYFSEATTQMVIDRFYQALVKGGWLMVGHSEPSLLTYRAFQPHTFQGALFYQKKTSPAAWSQAWEEVHTGQDKRPVNGLSLPVANGADLSLLASPVKSMPPAKQPLSNPDSSEAGTGELARLLVAQGQAEQAVVLLEEQLDTAPDDQQADLYSLLARAYADLGQWEKAHQHCQQAIALDKLQPDPYYTLALVHEFAGETEEAISNLKKVIYLNPEHPVAHFNLAMLYHKINRPLQAKRAVQTLVSLLGKWPPDKIVPDSGGSSAQRLLDAAQRALKEIEDVADKQPL